MGNHRDSPAPAPLADLVRAVQHNCDLSDARHAGDYGLCTFLLKMREYYRWEAGIPLSGELSKAAVGDWLTAREAHWETLEADDYAAIPLAGDSADPFDADVINEWLAPQGLVYSGGLGRCSKPGFFLGELLRDERRHGLRILISGHEYARDIAAPPAMLQGHTLYIRRESVRRFLWEKIQEWRWHPGDTGMAEALAACDFDLDPEAALDRMTEMESEVMLWHELGEAEAGRRLGPAWGEMVASLSRSRGEVIVRAVRDHLADCLSTLPELLAHDMAPSLHFYFATFDGMRKELFPMAHAAYLHWRETGDTGQLHEAVAQGGMHWEAVALRLQAEHAETGLPPHSPASFSMFRNTTACSRASSSATCVCGRAGSNQRFGR